MRRSRPTIGRELAAAADVLHLTRARAAVAGHLIGVVALLVATGRRQDAVAAEGTPVSGRRTRRSRRSCRRCRRRTARRCRRRRRPDRGPAVGAARVRRAVAVGDAVVADLAGRDERPVAAHRGARRAERDVRGPGLVVGRAPEEEVAAFAAAGDADRGGVPRARNREGAERGADGVVGEHLHRPVQGHQKLPLGSLAIFGLKPATPGRSRCRCRSTTRRARRSAGGSLGSGSSACARPTIAASVPSALTARPSSRRPDATM